MRRGTGNATLRQVLDRRSSKLATVHVARSGPNRELVASYGDCFIYHAPSKTDIVQLLETEDSLLIPQTAATKLKPERTHHRNRLHLSFEEKTDALGKFLGVNLKEGEILDLDKEQIRHILATDDLALSNAVYDYADTVTQHYFGKHIYFRGIVEFSNVCAKDCGYCGIRKHMPAGTVNRYTMSKEEIIDSAMFAYDNEYGSLMLQSGELPNDKRLAFLVDLVGEIKKVTIARDEEKRAQLLQNKDAQEIKAVTDLPGQQSKEARKDLRTNNKGLGVALSVGELPKDHYRQLREAGAHRYLLRIETANPDLYHKLHPPDHSWERRVECLKELRDLGYQVGTGVMIGLPHQTLNDLAGDLLFFKEMDVDMIGMGPYILQKDTPIGHQWQELYPNLDMKKYNGKLFELSTKMVALARILLGDVNIAATTALQAVNPIGREIALNRGANMLMPILTPRKYRESYQLYEGKPCIDEGAEECRGCLKGRVTWAGKELMLGEWGDPLHYFRTNANVSAEATPTIPRQTQQNSSMPLGDQTHS